MNIYVLKQCNDEGTKRQLSELCSFTAGPHLSNNKNINRRPINSSLVNAICHNGRHSMRNFTK